MKFTFLIFLNIFFLVSMTPNYSGTMFCNDEVNVKSKNTCVENLIFKSNYLESLKYIEDYVEGKKNNKKEFGNCIDKMTRNSGVRSSAYYGYIFRYLKKKDFYTDKKKWLSWYEKNKCENLKWK